MILSIDTSSRYGGVALSDSDGLVVEVRLWRSTTNHTAQLMPAVSELLKAQDTRAADLDGVAVALARAVQRVAGRSERGQGVGDGGGLSDHRRRYPGS